MAAVVAEAMRAPSRRLSNYRSESKGSSLLLTGGSLLRPDQETIMKDEFVPFGRFVIDHNSVWYTRFWNLTVVVAFVTLFTLPIRIVFIAGNDTTHPISIVETCFEYIFYLDIVLKTITSSEDDTGVKTRSHSRIVLHYLKMDFWIDIMCVTAFEKFHKSLKYLLIVRIMRGRRVYNAYKEISKDTKIRSVSNAASVPSLAA